MIPHLTGKRRKLLLANNEQHEAVYVIVDLDDLMASHNELTFSDTEGYPVNDNGTNINDRNYQGDINAQRNVQSIAENLNPESIIALTSTAAGTPIIDKNGIVVSGNNRVMSLKLAVKQFPEKYEEYKNQLAQDIDVFGFENYIGTALLMNDNIPLPGSSFHNPSSIKFKHPVLVRIDENLPEKLTTEDLAKYNQDTKKGERPLDRAIKLSNILLTNERCRNAILTIIDGYDTFSDIYSAEGKVSRKRLIENFIECGLITQAQLPSYYEEGQFTDAGKDFIETVLSAIILTPDALKISNTDGVKRLRQIVIGSLPLLITNANLGPASLKDSISEALIVQYKIMLAGGDFSDYMRNQSLFKEDKASSKALYLNSLLRVGRNVFKNSIRKYNESVKSNKSNSLFGASEQLTVPEIFNLSIVAAVDETDKKIISMYTNDTPAVSDEKVDEKIITDEEKDNYSFFFSDNFFIENPDNILGEPYQTSGRYGTITKYRGDIGAISRIDVPLDFIGNTIDPLKTSNAVINITGELSDPVKKEWIEKVVNKAIVQAGEKQINKTARKKSQNVEDDAVVGIVPQLQSFEDVYRSYNPEISKEETRVFIWYKTKINKPLSRQWVNLVEPGTYNEHLTKPESYYVDEESINMWIQQGLVYYYSGELVPAPMYLSGNIYEKRNQLIIDKADIIEKYGQDVFDRQEQAFDKIWQQVYKKRLTINESKNSLVILPISKLSWDFRVKTLNMFEPDQKFKVYTVNFSRDFKEVEWDTDLRVSESSKEDKESLSLTDAFCYWLLYGKPELMDDITHLEIVKYYCFQLPPKVKAVGNDEKEREKDAKAKSAKLKGQTQAEGERLFKQFLNEQLTINDKIKLETTWNTTFNNYYQIDFNKIPVAFPMCRYYKGSFEELKWEKREAVAFTLNNGSAIISYDVGVGKTPSSIFTISAFMAAGYCKRPFLVVPNQVYKQFISELKNFAPHIPVLEGYNLSAEYAENFKGSDGKVEKVPEGVVTVFTYEALEYIGFTETTINRLSSKLYEILNQGDDGKKAKVSLSERIETLMGKGLKGYMFNIEDFGFDFVCYDEAHKMKKVFSAVKGEMTGEENNKERERNPYQISAGVPSASGLKGFMLNYYIQSINDGQNVLMLTATPFTNSPIEIFSMLSMVAYRHLAETDMANLKSFFDNYIHTTTELVINARLKPQFKQVVLGFNNLPSLQSLIRRFINYKTGEDVNVIRPNKIILPYKANISDGLIIEGNVDRIDTFLSFSKVQADFMSQIILYVEGKINQVVGADNDDFDEDDDSKLSGAGNEIDMGQLNDKQKAGVRALQGLNWARSLAISPYLFKHSGLGKPKSYREYIKSSPKLMYVMNCIKSVKEYHESKGEEISGQVIYSERGIEYFGLIKEWLVKEVGYKENEIGIIVSGLPKDGKRSKEYVKNLFNGERYNEQTKLYEPVNDSERIKVVIGSATIKEGINLQRYGTVIYNCSIDWNPTDIQQIEGRVWRQGNTYKSVRVVVPLMLDSADIFIFQKLQEKTSRLNNIWATDGHTTALDIEDFNPEELKYALIRDPEVIAGFKSAEETSKIKNKIMSLNREKETIKDIISAVGAINKNYQAVINSLKGYRKLFITDNILENCKMLYQIISDQKIYEKDEQGRLTLSADDKNPSKAYWEDADEYKARMKKLSKGNISPLPPYERNAQVSEFAFGMRQFLKYDIEFIQQKGIKYFSLTNIQPVIDYELTIDQRIKENEQQIQYINSDDYKKQIIDQEEQRRKENKLLYKTLDETVNDFTRLNYLLSERKIKISGQAKYKTCPPMLPDGTRDISPDALFYLDECLSKLPQTKDTYFDKETNSYSEERKSLHNKIINSMFEGVKCVTKGQPVAVLTGGPPGSGKSTYLKKMAPYLLTNEVFHLDADLIREQLKPEYEGWNANATHKETQDIVNDILAHIGDVSCRYDIVYDGTMNKANKYFSLINTLKNLNYKVFIIFMDIPYAVARKRVINRYQKHGRYVPMEVIDDFFRVIPDHNGLTMGQYALNELKTVVDGYIVIDGITGQIIEKGGEPLPRERNYENQSAIDFNKWKLGQTNVEEIPEIPLPDKQTPVSISENNQVNDFVDEVKTAILGLQLLADEGDIDAINAIAGLKLLLE